MPGSKSKKSSAPRLSHRASRLAGAVLAQNFDASQFQGDMPTRDAQLALLAAVHASFDAEGVREEYTQKKMTDALQNRIYKWKMNQGTSNRPPSWAPGSRTQRRRKQRERQSGPAQSRQRARRQGQQQPQHDAAAEPQPQQQQYIKPEPQQQQQQRQRQQRQQYIKPEPVPPQQQYIKPERSLSSQLRSPPSSPPSDRAPSSSGGGGAESMELELGADACSTSANWEYGDCAAAETGAYEHGAAGGCSLEPESDFKFDVKLESYDSAYNPFCDPPELSGALSPLGGGGAGEGYGYYPSTSTASAHEYGCEGESSHAAYESAYTNFPYPSGPKMESVPTSSADFFGNASKYASEGAEVFPTTNKYEYAMEGAEEDAEQLLGLSSGATLTQLSRTFSADYDQLLANNNRVHSKMDAQDAQCKLSENDFQGQYLVSGGDDHDQDSECDSDVSAPSTCSASSWQQYLDQGVMQLPGSLAARSSWEMSSAAGMGMGMSMSMGVSVGA